MRRNIGNSSLKNLQQGLLNALTADITCNRRIFGFSRNFVDFIDIYDALFGFFNIVVGRLNKTQQNIFNIFADIARFGKSCGISNCKRNIQDFSKCLGKHCFAYTCGTQKNNIALLYVHVTFSTIIYSFIMVIYRNAQCNFCVVLPYNVFVEKFFYVVRLRKRFIGLRSVFSDVFKSAAVFNYLETKFNTVITNAYTAGTGNKLTDFILRFTAKRATHGLTFAVIIS